MATRKIPKERAPQTLGKSSRLKPLMGFIGQGWIGKNYADDFENRGYRVVRYALEEPYRANKDKIADCDIVIIAVPTPTTDKGFDDSAVHKALKLVGKGKIAIIKSTIVPGTTAKLKKIYPDRIILHSPEFLREAHAAEDAAHPHRNLIGIPHDDEEHRAAARRVLSVLPPAPYESIMSSHAAELVKYAGNVFLMLKVVYANMLYDLAGGLSIDYDKIREALAADPRIGPSHLSPVMASGHTNRIGRGAGGHCFMKDFEAFRQLYRTVLSDKEGSALLNAVIRKNNMLLLASEKDLDLLMDIYGHPSTWNEKI